MCPNPDLRLQMSLLYGYLLKVDDDDNREQAIDSLILACSFLDSHMDNEKQIRRQFKQEIFPAFIEE